MTTLDFSQIELQKLITHYIGNQMHEEPLGLSTQESILEENTTELLLEYFLKPMKPENFYSFTHAVELEMNEVFTLINSVFAASDSFIEASQSLAKLLYGHSTHPKIKSGQLNVVYLNNVVLGDELLDAIGIFKSETDAPFLKMDQEQGRFNIHHDLGFEIKGLDKGCLIFNTDKTEGYRMLIVDNANKSAEAVYWKDDFLRVEPIADEFYHTQQFMTLAKNFVVEEYAQTFEANKADQIDLLNRSVDFMKNNDTFEQQNFETEVLQEASIIEAFRNYDQHYEDETGMERANHFEISTNAVKKQARFFKSVLKLDKNFHVYIHGDKNMIERGVEIDGRKYYKLYYEEES